MKTKNTNKRIKKWSDFLADAAIHPSNVYSVGLQFVYDHGQLPSGMTNITPGDILNLQRENGLSACDVPGHVDDWVTIDGNPGDDGGGSGSSVVTESSIPANPTDQQRGHVPTVGAVKDALGGKQNALPTGTAGQVLKKTQSGVEWGDESVPTISDGENNPVDLAGTIEVTTETASGSEAGVTVTPKQGGGVEMKFSLPKGADGADGQDGAPGAPGHNPNLGTYLDTDTNKPTTGQAGDYYIVINTTVTQMTASVWVWNENDFADTEKSVEDFVTQFASGQPVTDVHIKDLNGDDDPNAQGVLSAEAGMALDEKIGGLKEQLIYNTEITNLTLNSPYYVETLNDGYMAGSGYSIVRNQYTASYSIVLFRLPAGKYKATKLHSATNVGAIVATFASTNDFVVGGTPSSIILNSAGTSQGSEVEFNLTEETLVALLAKVSSGTLVANNYGKVEEIKITTLKDTVEDLEQEITDLDVEELSEKVQTLEDEFLTKEAINITLTSPYFVETLSDAYIPASTIVRNPYTSSYKLSLFRLPAGKYKATKMTSSSTSYGTLVSIFASTDNFVVGGTTSSNILISTGTTQGTEVEFTLTEETLVCLTNGTSGLNNLAKVEKIEEVSNVPTQIYDAFKVGLDIVIPDIVYAIVGTELNIWNDTVALSIDKGLMSPINYQIRWGCSKGTITDRCFRFTPTASDVGNLTCNCYIYDIIGNLAYSKEFTIKVLAKDALQSSKNIVYFGDSLGSGAATALYDNFNDSNRFGGTIPNMLGTHGTTKHYEAVGGYKWESYATKGSPAYRVNVSNVSSVGLWAVYSDGSHNFEVIEVNITEGTGNILLSRHYTNPGTLIMPTGTLTKVSGSGDSTIPYTGAFQESANPLWNETTEQLDINQYKTMLVNLGQLSSVNDVIDAVSFQFGINDSILANNLPQLHEYIDDLYNLFVGDNPNCKFIIGLTTSSGNDVNGSGANYGASNNWEGYLKNTYNIRKYYLTLLQEYPNLRIATPNLYLDRYYGYAFGTRQISDRYTTTEQYHTNYVHPDTSGYNQMADAYLACYVGVLTEE